MGTRLESGNGASTEVQEKRRVKTTADKKQRIPRWGIFLFVFLITLAILSVWGFVLEKATNALVTKILPAKKLAPAPAL